MDRKPRIEFEGGFYHVITLGNQRQKVSLDEKDFLKYLEFLTDYKDRYGFWIYAHVLMSTQDQRVLGDESFVERVRKRKEEVKTCQTKPPSKDRPV